MARPTDARGALPEVRAELQQMDLLALLSEAIGHLTCIRTHAEHEASWQQVFIEAHQCLKILEAMKAQESMRWHALDAALQERNAVRAAATGKGE